MKGEEKRPPTAFGGDGVAVASWYSSVMAKRNDRRGKRTKTIAARLRDFRRRFQFARPTPEELLKSGDVAEFVPLGDYLSLREAVLALKKQREQRGLSLAAVAERANMDKAAVSRLENGLQANPTIDTLNRYAAAIDAEIVWSVRAK
jgi:ribosome-binding protein aMBF1 (putative translation factor)